ncbi:MAG TPA: tetratricopeptide repeat protein, partial [Polyangia bacterium]|nr:tetratricopeptide repeat protein [Polyangia bacterium]
VLAKEVARQYIERNNARFALAKLQACFKVDPRDTETLEMLARAFEQLGQTSKTVSVLKELAKVYADSGRANERVGVFKRIAALDPNDAEARDVLSTRASYVPPRPSAPVAPVAPVAPMRPPAPEPPRRRREAAITFSEMAIPQFLQQQAEPPAIEVTLTQPPSTSERMAIATGLLEPAADEAQAQVQRIIHESDTFVKYGLTERAVDHLKKVFELQPQHPGALERLAAVLSQLGRKAEAAAQLEVLAEQMALSQPDAAAGYARRALDLDPRSRRAQKVMEIVAGKKEPEDEFEELSSSLIQMETPQPEEIPRDDSTGFEITEGESTSVTPSIFTSSTEAVPTLEPAMSEVIDRTNSERRGGGEVEEAAEADFDVTQRRTVPVDDPSYSVMAGELEQIDFFIEQGLTDDARVLLDDVVGRFPPSPLLDERKRRIVELEQAAPVGAVPVAPGTVGHAQASAGSSGISPKAMVAAGGEMDLESHRDLGIGYKDMGLFDAAIREFNILMKDSRHEVFALTMIGECHESKGALADAVAFYKKALNKPAISDDEATALYFQLGSVFQTMGETNEALYFFEKVMKRDANFRDVRRRINDLRGGEAGRGFDALLGKNR